MNILMIVLLVVIFYFFMIRPQQKRQKEITKFQNVAEGDRVITAGGIYGRVRRIKETTFSIEIAPNTVITVDKNMVYPSAPDAQQDGEGGINLNK